jgi:hypothetical protein
MADLEHILQQLHDSEINAGVQTFYDAGMRVWIGRRGQRQSKPKRRSSGRPLLASSGRKGLRQRAGYTRPRYVCTPIANMPKRTAVDRQAELARG